MEIIEKPRLLICGDSYMAFDHRKEEFNDIHWATHLRSFANIDNRAFPGASNTQIHIQLINAVLEYKPDYIVLGFTGCNRLEFDEQLTSCHPHADLEKQKLHTMYKTHIDSEIEVWRNIFVVNSCIQLAKSLAPTAYSLNLLGNYLSNSTAKYDLVTKISKEELPSSLIGHDESTPNDHDFRTYHIRDESVLKNYSQQIVNNLLTLQ